MSDSALKLETLAQEFKAWRGNSRHRAYPKQFWDEIKTLSQNYSASDIAKALGINQEFLRQKLRNDPPEFIPVHLKTFYSIVSMDFRTAFNEHPITVRFQSDHEQLARLIIFLSDHHQ
jgi:hypothetical protein